MTPLKTHCYRGHPYDETNTRLRRNGGRYCGECTRIRQRLTYTRTPREPLPNKVYDYLQVYMGWRTALGIATDLGIRADTTYSTLYRLRRKGLVVDRTVGLGMKESRREWRAA